MDVPFGCREGHGWGGVMTSQLWPGLLATISGEGLLVLGLGSN